MPSLSVKLQYATFYFGLCTTSIRGSGGLAMTPALWSCRFVAVCVYCVSVVRRGGGGGGGGGGGRTSGGSEDHLL